MSSRPSVLIRWSPHPPTQKMSATAEARSKEGLSYKPLSTEFRRDGFQYRQIAREGDAAIYEQTWNGCRNPSVSLR
jgi:hypothetical protein